MSDLDKAIARLEAAALELEQILADAVLPEPKEDPVLRRERDMLASEVAALRDAAERDAELRAEAAEAVRAALNDLRALVPEEHSNG